MLEINLEEAILKLKGIKAKKILLQIPEGLKIRVNKIILELEKKGFEVITSMDPCFGACDIKVREAEENKCDAILHLGHNAFVEKTSLPVIYAPLNYELENFEKIIDKLIIFLRKKKISKIGLVTTIQYINYIPIIKEILKENGIKIETQKRKRVVEGQVLGCNYSAVPKKTHTIYFGDGLFHPLGIHFSKQKEVIIVNPLTEELKMLDKEKDKFLRKRILLIEKAKEADSFAILVTSKIGQNRITEARKIKKELEKKGKKANIYIMDFINEDKLLGIKEEAYISTACPRLSIDDFASFKKAIINFTEVKYFFEGYDNYKLEEVY